MQIKILAKQVEVTPSLKEYIEKKIGTISRFLSRFEKDGEKIVFIEIARTTRHHKQGEVYYAEATLELPGKILRAEYEHADPRAAIDQIKDVLKLEIKKYKDLKVFKGRRGKT